MFFAKFNKENLIDALESVITSLIRGFIWLADGPSRRYEIFLVDANNKDKVIDALITAYNERDLRVKIKEEYRGLALKSFFQV